MSLSKSLKVGVLRLAWQGLSAEIIGGLERQFEIEDRQD